MYKPILKSSFAIFIITLIIGSSISSYTDGKQNPIFYETTDDTGVLDAQFIYNITAALSNIIFTEYDEENGEIAKGRAFGTKGERKAAEILAENMTQLGLDTTLEQLDDRPGIPNDPDTHKLEVLDYELRLNDELVDCYPAASWAGPRGDRYQLNTTFNHADMKIIPMPRFPCLYNPKYAIESEDFVFITNDQWNSPNYSLPITNILKPFLDPLKLYMTFHVSTLLSIQGETLFWRIFYPNCKGLLLYDFNKDCHDMIYFAKPYRNFLPVIFINGSTGEKIVESPDDFRLDYNLEQRYNESVISYNVVGTLEGEDSSKTVIISSLYDSWWCQGTADSAIGMGMVLAIAKYYVENKITPLYTMKFIGFSGEESNMRGANNYEAVHFDEKIIYIIDLNQVGFTQDEPALTLDIVSNDPVFLEEIWDVALRTDYVERTGNVTGIAKMSWPSGSIPSNPYPFVMNRKNCLGVSFFKNGGWILHHRDGLNHTEGDVLKYFNWTDVNLTGELVLNITKYFTVEKEITPSGNESLITGLDMIAKDI